MNVGGGYGNGGFGGGGVGQGRVGGGGFGGVGGGTGGRNERIPPSSSGYGARPSSRSRGGGDNDNDDDDDGPRPPPPPPPPRDEIKSALVDLHRLLYVMEQQDGGGGGGGGGGGAGGNSGQSAAAVSSWRAIVMRADMLQFLWQQVSGLAADAGIVEHSPSSLRSLEGRVQRAHQRAQEVANDLRRRQQQQQQQQQRRDDSESPAPEQEDAAIDPVERAFFNHSRSPKVSATLDVSNDGAGSIRRRPGGGRPSSKKGTPAMDAPPPSSQVDADDFDDDDDEEEDRVPSPVSFSPAGRRPPSADLFSSDETAFVRPAARNGGNGGGGPSIQDLQKAQRELIEQQISQMASQMKSETERIHSTLKTQTDGVLNEMEDLAADNVAEVTRITDDVEDHVRQNWSRAVGTWTMLFTMMGTFLVCLITILMVPKNNAGYHHHHHHHQSLIPPNNNSSVANGIGGGGNINRDKSCFLYFFFCSEKKPGDKPKNCRELPDGGEDCSELDEWEALQLDLERLEAMKRKQKEEEDDYYDEEYEEGDYDGEEEYDEGDYDEEYDEGEYDEEYEEGEYDEEYEGGEYDEEYDEGEYDEEHEEGEYNEEEEEEKGDEQVCELDINGLCVTKEKGDDDRDAEQQQRQQQAPSESSRRRHPKEEGAEPTVDDTPAFSSLPPSQDALDDALRELDDTREIDAKEAFASMPPAEELREAALQEFHENRRETKNSKDRGEREEEEVTVVNNVPLHRGKPFYPQDIRKVAAVCDNFLLTQLLKVRPQWADVGDSNGWTSFHLAARSGCVETMKILTDASQPRTVASDGKTARDVAVKYWGEDHAIVSLL